jgi:hypothetical protein
MHRPTAAIVHTGRTESPDTRLSGLRNAVPSDAPTLLRHAAVFTAPSKTCMDSMRFSGGRPGNQVLSEDQKLLA